MTQGAHFHCFSLISLLWSFEVCLLVSKSPNIFELESFLLLIPFFFFCDDLKHFSFLCIIDWIYTDLIFCYFFLTLYLELRHSLFIYVGSFF